MPFGGDIKHKCFTLIQMIMNSTNDQIKHLTATDGKPHVMRSVCPKCEGKGWYFVDEWIGSMQGRKDCKCKGKLPL